MPPGIDHTEFNVLKNEVHHVKNAIVDMATTMKELSSTMVKLVAVDEKQIQHSEALTRAFAELSKTNDTIEHCKESFNVYQLKCEKRFTTLEAGLKPATKLVGIALTGAVSLCGVVALAILKFVGLI